MKSKNLMMAAILMLSVTTVNAQQNIQKAFDALLSKNVVEITTNHSLERDPETGRKTLQADVYDFMVTDPSVLRYIKDIQVAFDKDKDDAYLVRSGDHAGDNYASLAVGDGRSQSVAIGNMKGSRFIYACFLDKDDPEKKYRYAYAMEWVEKDKRTQVRLAKTYATTAKYRSSRKSVRRVIVNGREVPDSVFFNLERSSESWLSMFNTYKNLFLKNPNGTASSHYATYIHTLCKNAAPLDDTEKYLVATEIQKLKDVTNDEFIKQLFDMSIKRLTD